MCAQHREATKYAELAKRVLRLYPKSSLMEAKEGYGYRFESSPEDDRTWTNFRRQGYMTLLELKGLSRWKTGGRQKANIVSNSQQAVKAVTCAATQVNSEVPNEPALPIGILTSLHGVDIPTASTVMTVWEPQRFAILDIRVWQALGKAQSDAFRSITSKQGNRRPFRPYEVALYLGVIREVAAQTSLSCREIDKALWVLGEAS